MTVLRFPIDRMSIEPPPIDLRKDFWTDHEALFNELRSAVVWDERLKARMTASFGLSYDYSQMKYPDTEMHAALVPVCAAVGASLGFTPNNCLLNYYPTGKSTMGFHSDSPEQLTRGTGVAILSLGSVRTIVYRRKTDHEVRFEYPLEHGCLLYMSNEMQDEWQHGVRKESGAGPRISVTLRSIAK